MMLDTMPIRNHRKLGTLPVLLFGASAVLWTGLLSAQNYDLDINDNGLISLHASGAPVEELLNAIGDEMGFSVWFPSPLEDRVSIDFQELELEQAIKQLTKSYILVTDKESDAQSVKEIIVMPEGESSGYLPKAGNIAEQNRQADEAAGVVKNSENNPKLDQIKRRLQAGVQEQNPEEIAEEELVDGVPAQLPGVMIPPAPETQ